MNSKKTNLITDTEAVSGAIGVILLMAIAVTTFTMLQATAVPLWNKQVEKAHMPVAYDDMMTLKSDIEDVATLDVTKSSDINLGARYPDRMIFRNPGPGAYGTLTVEGNVSIEIEYDGTSEIINSSRITYELYGMTPKIVYEHGILIRDYGNNVVLGPIPPDNQSLYDTSTDNIYIPIVNSTSFSVSSLDTRSLTIFPFTDTNTDNSPLPTTITLATKYRRVWENLTRSIDNVTVSGDEITIVSDSIEQIQLSEIDVDEMYGGAIYSGIARFYKTPPSSGSYGGSNGGEQSEYADADSDYVNVTGGGGKENEVLDLRLENIGEQIIVVDYVKVSWEEYTDQMLEYIYIEEISVSGDSGLAYGPGLWAVLTDAAPTSKGTLPYRFIEPGVQRKFDFYFSQQDVMEGKTFTIDFLLSDGSIKEAIFST